MPTLIAVLLSFAGIVLYQQFLSRTVRGTLGADVSRRLLFLAPLLIVLLLRPMPPSEAQVSVPVATVGGLLTATLVWLAGLRNLRRAVQFAQDGVPPTSGEDALGHSLSLVGGPLVQEPVYRMAMLWPLAGAIGNAAAVALTALLFVAEHRFHYHQSRFSFQKADYARQAALGVVFGALSIASASVVPSLLGHLAYNAIPWSLVVVRYRNGRRGEFASA